LTEAVERRRDAGELAAAVLCSYVGTARGVGSHRRRITLCLVSDDSGDDGLEHLLARPA
jgi:hypothetical protein